jgi:hypothetical protein
MRATHVPFREALECGSDRATALGGRAEGRSRDEASISGGGSSRFHRPPKAVALPPHSKVRRTKPNASVITITIRRSFDHFTAGFALPENVCAGGRDEALVFAG